MSTLVRSTPARRLSAAARLPALVLATGLVAGCHVTTVTDSGYPMDYAQRHPIRMVEAPAVHEILIGTGRSTLTAEQRAELTAFAGSWRQRGTGALVIEVPAGTANEYAASRAAREVRSVLLASGVPRFGISTRPYQPQPYNDLAPIRVAHPTLRADAGPCGVWPDDLGVTDWKHQIENRPYWNLGCANQKALAAMVANPADLIQPRSQQPPYAPRRQTVIEKYRQGQDTGTVSSQEETTLSDVGK